MIKNLMTISELAKMYDVSDITMRTILCRSDFAKFCQGRMRLPKNPRVLSYYYNCTGEFDKILKEHLKRTKVYRKKLLS